MKRLLALILVLAGGAFRTAVALEIPVLPQIQLLYPSIPGDPKHPDRTMGKMWEHSLKILREFDSDHQFGSERGVLVAIGGGGNGGPELDEHRFIAMLTYSAPDPAGDRVDVRLRIYDSQRYLKYEYNFEDVFHADGESIQEIAAQIANYAKAPKQFEVLNQAGDEAEPLDMDDNAPLDLSEFSDSAEDPVPTPTVPPTVRQPSASEIAERNRRIAQWEKELAEYDRQIITDPNDPTPRYGRLHLLSQIANQHPWEERIALWESALVEYDAYRDHPSSRHNQAPIYVPATFFIGLEVTPESQTLPPELLERRNRVCAAFRDRCAAEQLNAMRKGFADTPELAPTFQALVYGTMTMFPPCYWDYATMQRDRNAALTAFLRGANERVRQHPEEAADWNRLLLETFAGTVDPAFGTCPWSDAMAAQYRAAWGDNRDFQALTAQSPLPFARTLGHQQQLIAAWLDPTRTDFAAFRADYARMLEAIRRDTPEWFLPGNQQSASYFNNERLLLLEDFVTMRFPAEAPAFLDGQRQELTRQIMPK